MLGCVVKLSRAPTASTLQKILCYVRMLLSGVQTRFIAFSVIVSKPLDKPQLFFVAGFDLSYVCLILL